MNRAARRSAAAERLAEADGAAFERSVPVDAGSLDPATQRRPKRPRPAPVETTGLADDEPLEGAIPEKRRLDLGFGLVIDSRELRAALLALADRVAARTETAPPRWTHDEWRESCRGAWRSTPHHSDDSPDHTQRRCYRCALCTWEEWLDAYNAQHPESDRPVRERPPPPTIEDCVWTACYRTEGHEGLSAMGSTIGAMVERADVFGRPRVTDLRDRDQVRAVARRIGAWRRTGRWTERVHSNPTRSMQARTPDWARAIEGAEEYRISWRWALSCPDARGGLTEREAAAVVYGRLHWLVFVDGEPEPRTMTVDELARETGRNPEQVRAIVGAVLTRFRADLAARRFLPPVHPRSSAFRLYQERLVVRGAPRVAT